MIKPSADQIAEAIRKRDQARIIPTGPYAQYRLGLTTQIPMNIVYLTDGSPRKVHVGNQKIRENMKYAPVWIRKHITNILNTLDNESLAFFR